MGTEFIAWHGTVMLSPRWIPAPSASIWKRPQTDGPQRQGASWSHKFVRCRQLFSRIMPRYRNLAVCILSGSPIRRRAFSINFTHKDWRSRTCAIFIAMARRWERAFPRHCHIVQELLRWVLRFGPSRQGRVPFMLEGRKHDRSTHSAFFIAESGMATQGFG